MVQRLFSPLGRVFVGAGFAFVYNLTYVVGIPEHGDVVTVWSRMALPLLVVWWVESDATQTRYWPAHHYAGGSSRYGQPRSLTTSFEHAAATADRLHCRFWPR